MSEEISEDTIKRIFKMISTPGVEIVDIAKELDIDFDIVMDILSNEYLRNNLDYGRRLCCRF